MNEKFVIVDVETTGNVPKRGDRIIQIGAIVVEQGVICDSFSSFINPETEIPPFIQQLTGISNEMVKDAPSFSEVAPKLMEFFNEAYFVAHNVPFDLAFLQKELELSGYSTLKIPTIDTVELARLLLPTEESFKLNQLALKLNIHHDRPHQADSDAEVTAQILMYLLKKLQALPLLTLQRLKPITKKLDSALEDILQTMITRKLTSLDLNEADDLEEFRQLVVRKPLQIIESAEDPTILSFTDEMSTLEENLTNSFQGFEVRAGQKEMMGHIDEAFQSNQHLLVEAGTGTGKSLAYLYPSLYYAKKNQISMVISTHTVQLQQQLIERDIDILKKTVPFSFRWALLKGRTHYLCLRKFEQQLDHHHDDNYDTLLSKGQIVIWLTETLDGDVEQLNLPSGGKVFWSDVQSDATTCIGKNCPWFSRCFYHRARNNAYGAELIVTNHALLFTDLTTDHALLPSYKQVVIDEAHHLEEVASDHFGTGTDYYSFLQILSKIGNLQSNDLLHKLYDIQTDLALNIDEFFQQMEVKLEQFRIELDDFFTQIHSFVSKRMYSSKSEVGKKSLRFFPNKMNTNGWEFIQEAVLRVQMLLKDILKLMKRINDEFSLNDEQLNYNQNGIVSSWKGYHSSLSEEKDNLEELILQYDPNFVYWIEADPKGAKNSTYIYNKPIEVAEILADNFFTKKTSVVMTSATLTVKNSFDYIISRLGLADYGVRTAIIESPFHYEQQVQLMIPTSLPNIKEVSEGEYIYDVVISILDIARVTKGRMLVLFTSYDMLRKAYYQLKDFIANEEFVLIGQGISSGSRAKLTKNFKQYDQAILFGTSSFWEGVDIPGEDLSCLVIVRLPFSPPNNPLFEARSENIKALGKSPFMELSLPQAIIRFKQGFGRLIRSSKDRGAVFVFDRRIVDTRYGKLFINSLPTVTINEGSLENLLYDLENWL